MKDKETTINDKKTIIHSSPRYVRIIPFHILCLVHIDGNERQDGSLDKRANSGKGSEWHQ